MKDLIIGNGAEALVYLDKSSGSVKKVRVKKIYRQESIDTELRKKRTRQESRILKKLEKANFPSPKELQIDEKNFSLLLKYIEGDKVRDVIGKKNCKMIANELARLIIWLHKLNIVHHDLTTSNMILCKGQVFLIDFGLSFISKKVEDKAVDIHLLKRAIESKHPELYDAFMNEFLNCYSKEKDAKDILKRLEVVEHRGRYK
jgi:TP53 regulating kinase-like protein